MRELVVPLALFAGMPIEMLVAYIRFLEGLRVYNAYATGLGTAATCHLYPPRMPFFHAHPRHHHAALDYAGAAKWGDSTYYC